MSSNQSINFWQVKELSQMTKKEWEELCDGCGKCCLCKIEYEDTGEICYTTVSCKLFNSKECKCTNYSNRATLVKDCAVLTPSTPQDFQWLPKTCSYRLIYEGKPLPSWHHLITGSPDTIHEEGMSVADKTISEEYINPDDLENYIMDFAV